MYNLMSTSQLSNFSYAYVNIAYTFLCITSMHIEYLYFFIVPVIGAMRGCVVPVIRSMLSKLTPPTQQGLRILTYNY